MMGVSLFAGVGAKAGEAAPDAQRRTGWRRLVDSRDELRRGKVGSTSRYVLAPGKNRFDLTGVEQGTIRVSFGVAEPAWQRGLEEVEFAATVRSGGKVRASQTGRVTAQDGTEWRDLTLTVPPPNGLETVLVLEARSVRGSGAPRRMFLWTPPKLTPKPVSSQRNIVLVSIDTLRADHLGCYGYERDTSPNIDRLAAQGVVFKKTIASSSWTLPSHASMLTGLQPQHHGATRFGFAQNHLDEKVDTLAEILWDHDYETAAVVGGGFVSAFYGLDQGFGRFFEQNNDDFDQTVAAATSWLDRGVQRPFFLFLHTYAVHTPYTPPERYTYDGDYSGPFARAFTNDDAMALNTGMLGKLTPRTIKHLEALYDGEISELDRVMQKFVDYLTSTGLAKSTCVIITSDHGEEFEEHGDLFHRHAKLYEELIDVPLIVWCPSMYEGGRVVDEPVSLVDISPTVLSVAGISVPPEVDGYSQEPVLSRGEAPVNDVTLSHVDKSLNPKDSLLPEVPPSNSAPLQSVDLGAVVAARTARYKLIRDLPEGRIELFDLLSDPGETKDVSAENPEVVARLQGALDRVSQKFAAPRPARAGATPDAATQERLRALGYIP